MLKMFVLYLLFSVLLKVTKLFVIIIFSFRRFAMGVKNILPEVGFPRIVPDWDIKNELYVLIARPASVHQYRKWSTGPVLPKRKYCLRFLSGYISLHCCVHGALLLGIDFYSTEATSKLIYLLQKKLCISKSISVSAFLREKKAPVVCHTQRCNVLDRIDVYFYALGLPTVAYVYSYSKYNVNVFDDIPLHKHKLCLWTQSVGSGDVISFDEFKKWGMRCGRHIGILDLTCPASWNDVIIWMCQLFPSV